MTALELQDKESHIGPEAIKKAIDNLTDGDFKVCIVMYNCVNECDGKLG